MSGIKAFILHLERASGRAPTVAALQSALPVVSEILPAVDGALLSADQVKAAYARSRYRPRYPFALGANEVGAFLSHRAAWARIVAEPLDFAAVFEDDAAVDPSRFSAVLDLAAAERAMWDYVLMPAAGLEPKGDTVVERGGYRLVRPYAPPLRAIAQLVSRAAAERLLALTQPFDRPVDTFLQMNWITGVTLMAALPTPVRDVSRSTGGTTVQRKRLTLAERLQREIMRPAYRAQVLARYRREALKARGSP